MKHAFAQKLLQQGIAASKAGQREEAQRMLLQVTELDPDSESAWLWLSSVVDGTAKRRHCLEQVLALNPDNAHARAGLTYLEKQAAQEVHPLDSDIRTPQSTPFQPDPGAEAGDRCPFCHKPVAVHSAICPHCQRDLVVLCPTCEARMEVEELNCRVCGHQLGDYRQGATYFATLGDAYLANLKADLAVVAWQQVLAIDSNYPNGHLRLGEAQTAAGDSNGAHASFEAALHQTTDPATAYLGLGRIYERRHKWDEAQKVYEKAVAADESSIAAQFALGRLLMEGRSLQNAFPHIRQTTELNPEHTEAWFLLGRLYELAQERRKAIRAYSRATELAKRDVPGSSAPGKQAAERLEMLRPSLPPSVALNWPETVRQTISWALIPALAALVNGGLRPWQIDPLDLLGVLLAVVGAYFWVSAVATPRNPGMRAMLGQEGLAEPAMRMFIGLLGGLFWTIASLYIVLFPLLAAT
jgi:tetratricopeptide (TPR) repeat protein